MLENRDYMRAPEFGEPPYRGPRWSWTVVLLVVYAIVFIAELAVIRFAPAQGYVFKYLVLSRSGLEHGYVWQLVTYQFMHAGWLHLLLNCWAIYAFGRELEMLLGEKRFLALMFSSGVVGGIFQVLTAMAWPQLFDGPVVGASACAFGLVAAFALLFPDLELTMLVFFVIPIHLRAKTLLILSAVLATVGIVFPWDNIANAAHLGGMAMGWFFVRKIMHGRWTLLPSRENRSAAKSVATSEEKSNRDYVESEVDPILEKISAHGIQSLTARERQVLEAARKKMSQR